MFYCDLSCVLKIENEILLEPTFLFDNAKITIYKIYII
jgi:hypothetical protein